MKLMGEKLLTPQECADLLKFKISTVYAFVHQKRIPYIKLGGRALRFDPERIREWVERQSKEPASHK